MAKTTCKDPTCDRPRYQTKNSVYTYCEEHQHQVWNGTYPKPTPDDVPPRLRDLPLPQPPHTPKLMPGVENVIITDWRNDTLRFGFVVYCDELPMPSQEGVRKALLYEFERMGWHIVRESVEMPE